MSILEVKDGYEGFRPSRKPLTLSKDASFELVLKIQETCNINCSYCYMYNVGNELFKELPTRASLETCRKVGEMLVSEFTTRNPKSVRLILHGGEPMLMKVADFESRLRAIEGVLRAALTDEQRARIQFLLQTNATLVNDDWVALLSRWGIKVGVSIDGPAHVHDHRRHDKRGRGTHSAVLRGFDKLQAAHISGELAAISVLCVINPNANGTEVYNYISRELDVKGFDFLLPFMNWDTYCEETVAKTGQFLTEAFDEWAADVRNGKRTRVRIFQNILASLSRPVERFREGNALNHQVVVVESDGTILPEESLRPTYSGRFSNLTIHHNTSQQVLNDPRFFATISGSMTRAEECAGCTLIDSCASGQALGRVGMRYSRDALYQRKSVYCAAFADLYVRAAAFLIQEKGVHLSTLALASEGVDELEMGSS